MVLSTLNFSTEDLILLRYYYFFFLNVFSNTLSLILIKLYILLFSRHFKSKTLNIFCFCLFTIFLLEIEISNCQGWQRVFSFNVSFIFESPPSPEGNGNLKFSIFFLFLFWIETLSKLPNVKFDFKSIHSRDFRLQSPEVRVCVPQLLGLVPRRPGFSPPVPYVFLP